jgi:exodeoxyribonuclease-3
MAAMKIATWNVNSIKARQTHVQRWLTANPVDVLCLQELKGMEFPAEVFSEQGYAARAVTQKTYNGVAILSKMPFETVLEKLPGDDTDDQARYLEADVAGVRVINIYLPNGNPVDTDKYTYKLSWMDRLYARLKTLRESHVPFLVTGDFNVIPEDRDCYDPKLWVDDALFKIETRQKFRQILNLGLTDAFRAGNNDPGQYTFWDYQAGCWPKNLGIRIDHFLTSPPVTDRLISCIIDTSPRAEDSPSDHTPVILEIA